MPKNRRIARLIPFVLIIVSFSLSALGQEKSIEDGWKAIKVFDSKRNEVEKILGAAGPQIDEKHAIYSTNVGNVVIIYSSYPCAKSIAGKGDYNVEKNTVMEYHVYFKTPFPLDDLKWDKTLYKRTAAFRRLGMFDYDTQKNGLQITTQDEDGIEMVGSLWFFSTDEQKRKFSCQKK